MDTEILKNVLYVSHQANFSGGASRSLYDLIQNLDRNRFIPFFASINDGEVAGHIKELAVPFIKLYPSSITPPFFAASSVILLWDFIIKNKIHLIHNNQCDDALYSWIPAKLTNTPILIHHRDPSMYKRNHFLVRHVDANIALSSWQNERNLSNKGVVIPEGLNLNIFISPRYIKQCHFVPNPDKVTVGLLGRIMPYKAQDVFIEAASFVLKRRKNVHFLIIGDDQEPRAQSYIKSLKSRVLELGIQESISFLGYFPDSKNILPILDISVVPSRKETFGRVTIESMAFSKPVIATNVWGALDIVTPETGILIPPDDPHSLAEAIIFLVDSPEIRLEFGLAGRKRVEDFFTIEMTMEKIQSLYDEILVRKRGN